jgi:NAD(P)-dependent dehydrogenase (short-subunit alcohol dehydrogenase family)
MKKLIELINSMRGIRGTRWLNNFDGKVAIICGASGSVGMSVARDLYDEGMNLVLVSRNSEKIRSIFSVKDDKRVKFVSVDVTKEEDVKQLVSEVLSYFGRIDVVVNTVGAFSSTSVSEADLPEVEKIFDANFKSVFLVCREVVKVMKKQKEGIIVNIGSRITRNSNVSSNKTLYLSSKYAMEGFSKALAKEVSKYGIRVVCLHPATISTFPTKNIFNYMLPEEVSKVVSFVIAMKNIDFDPISFKSNKQNI